MRRIIIPPSHHVATLTAQTVIITTENRTTSFETSVPFTSRSAKRPKSHGTRTASRLATAVRETPIKYVALFSRTYVLTMSQPDEASRWCNVLIPPCFKLFIRKLLFRLPGRGLCPGIGRIVQRPLRRISPPSPQGGGWRRNEQTEEQTVLILII